MAPRIRVEDRWPFIRSVLLFFGGLLGVGYEGITRSLERPFQLGVYVVMMGLPAFFGPGSMMGTIRNGNGKNGNGKPPSPPAAPDLQKALDTMNELMASLGVGPKDATPKEES